MSKRRGQKKVETPANATVIRHWRAGGDNDDAWLRFNDDIVLLLLAGRLGGKRMRGLLNRLDAEETELFIADVEDIAGTPIHEAEMMETGAPALASLHLFGIPLLGTKSGIAALCGDDERFDRLITLPRVSGYCTKESTVVLLEVPLSLTEMATLSPADIRELADSVILGLMSKDVLPRPPGAILKEIKKNAAVEGADTSDDALVARVLIGAQVFVDEEDSERKFDVLSLLRGDFDETTEEAHSGDISIADETWRKEVQETVQSADVFVGSPMPWGDIRHTLLLQFIEITLSTIVGFGGEEYDPAEIEMDLDMQGALLKISASHAGQHLTSLDIPAILVADAKQEFLDGLIDRYKVRMAEDAPRPTITLH